ncbi:MAG: beta-L-arabinofuranosidase domain-containing protein [Limnochordia bacterium]
MRNLQPLAVKDVALNKGLLSERMRVIREEVIPYQWKALNDQVPGAEPSHAIENLQIAAGEKEGVHHGFIFQDSDVAKWLEAVGYRLATHPDPELEKTADEVIELLGRAQEEDGYLNSFFTIMRPEGRWTNLRDDHELYCAGHLIEAAVAYYEGTGKRNLLDIVCRFVDLIDSVFGPEPGKLKGYPGHQEIELALIRLYHVTGDEKHLKLAKFFIDQRGQQPHYFVQEWEKRGETGKSWYAWPLEYQQSHLPVREQTKAVGHSVRAMYMYSAMVDVARETNDVELMDVAKGLWRNVVSKQMYITGGVGSQEYGEGFSTDYDLPSDTAYTETCAAIGLVFWAQRLLQVEPKAEYADVLERALFNGVLSGISLDGQRFFYVNPLEVVPEVISRRRDHFHVRPTRQSWFGCACCPPNIARLVASVGKYMYGVEGNALYVHLYGDNTAEAVWAGKNVTLRQETDYPYEGEVKVSIEAPEAVDGVLYLRIPGWCQEWNVKVNGEIVTSPTLEEGYLKLARVWTNGDTIELSLAMPVMRVRSNTLVRETIGKVALQRGPLVYCLEEQDNGANLAALILPAESEFIVEFEEELNVPILRGEAKRYVSNTDELYTTAEPKAETVTITAIPYFAWDNRKSGEMLVWLREG